MAGRSFTNHRAGCKESATPRGHGLEKADSKQPVSRAPGSPPERIRRSVKNDAPQAEDRSGRERGRQSPSAHASVEIRDVDARRPWATDESQNSERLPPVHAARRGMSMRGASWTSLARRQRARASPRPEAPLQVLSYCSAAGRQMDKSDPNCQNSLRPSWSACYALQPKTLR